MAVAVFFAATSLIAATAAVAAAGTIVAATVAALAVPARHANLFALAAVVILGLFLFLTIVVADGNHSFVATALGAAEALIAALGGAARGLGVATRFGRRRGNRRRRAATERAMNVIIRFISDPRNF